MRLKTRMPFRYGIAELTKLPHLFLELDADIDGAPANGIAADHLPPRWFTKDPAQSPEDEIAAMLRVVKRAARDAIGSEADTPFAWWRQAYARQMDWAENNGIPPLLAHFGLTLVERALISAFCHRHRAPFHLLLLSDRLGFDPTTLYPELAGSDWKAAFPAQPRPRLWARHTVGLSDPIWETDIPPAEQLADGLPQSLEANIQAYGLRHFKIKLSGDLAQDRARLSATLRCIEANAVNAFAFSLDGNESYPDLPAFRQQWLDLSKLPELIRHRDKLLFVEQPVHRDQALRPENRESLLKLADTPIIIDESDATLDSLPQALSLGYVGASHKNCKGVFKGLAAKCLLAHRQSRRSDSVPPLRQSGEDLSNIGPVALLQDLTVMATLDIASVERNGHHYFAGLAAFSDELNAEAGDALPDLFQPYRDGKAKLALQGGQLCLLRLLHTPFGPKLPHTLQLARPLPIAIPRSVA